jgi:nitrogen fixation/metabolism regulation signal transduction histidine kinase
METQEETLARLEEKIDAVYKSSEKSRKYLLTMLIATILMVVLPLILAGVMLPLVLSTFGNIYPI